MNKNFILFPIVFSIMIFACNQDDPYISGDPISGGNEVHEIYTPEFKVELVYKRDYTSNDRPLGLYPFPNILNSSNQVTLHGRKMIMDLLKTTGLYTDTLVGTDRNHPGTLVNNYWYYEDLLDVGTGIGNDNYARLFCDYYEDYLDENSLTSNLYPEYEKIHLFSVNQVRNFYLPSGINIGVTIHLGRFQLTSQSNYRNASLSFVFTGIMDSLFSINPFNYNIDIRKKYIIKTTIHELTHGRGLNSLLGDTYNVHTFHRDNIAGNAEKCLMNQYASVPGIDTFFPLYFCCYHRELIWNRLASYIRDSFSFDEYPPSQVCGGP